MPVSIIIRKCISFLAVTSFFVSVSVFAAGGISIQGTRIIYPQDSRQESISLRNSSTTDSFLVQSWVENADGEKSNDFIVTPPLYLSGPKNENILRLIRIASASPVDRESLYYFIARAIPSVDDKDSGGKSIVRIAAASRLKLFVRPSGLKIKPEEAPAQLKFKRLGQQLEITNPTPYYITMTEIRQNGRPLNGIMVAPMSSVKSDSSLSAGNAITFSTINDSGTITKPITAAIN